MNRSSVSLLICGLFFNGAAHATTATVPEPSVWALMAGGVAAAVIVARLSGRK